MKTLLTTFLICYILSANAQNKPSYAWLAGTWVGDGFGGTSEEVWSQPSDDGTMMGVYRHHRADGSLNFYEFLTLDETGMKLKHFTPDMVSWEDKEDFVHFEVIEYTENKILLNGLSFELMSDSEMEIRLDLKDGDKKWTEVFKMKRK